MEGSWDYFHSEEWHLPGKRYEAISLNAWKTSQSMGGHLKAEFIIAWKMFSTYSCNRQKTKDSLWYTMYTNILYISCKDDL